MAVKGEKDISHTAEVV